MATNKIPNINGQVRQLNINDTLGELWSTRNIDLHTNFGKIKLARPLKQVATSANVGNDAVQAFAVLGNKAYALTQTNLYRAGTPFTSWSLATASVSDAEDMVVFKGQLVITTNNNIDAYDGTTFTSNWWTARGNPTLTNNSPAVIAPHVLEVVRIGTETLAVTDGNEVHAYTGGISGSPILSTTVELDEAFVATCIRSTIRNVFIGTYTEDADQAYVFEWDGASTNYTQAYPTGAKAVLSMEIIDDAPMIVTERGEIKVFNNAGFTTVAQFPFAPKPLFADGVETGLIQSDNMSRPIHPKGMKRAGNIVYIYVNFEDAEKNLNIDNRTHNGLWALDLTTFSLTHLASIDNEILLRQCSPVMAINDRGGRVFIGGRKYDGTDGIWIEDLGDNSDNYGYLTTVEIESDSVKDAYDEIITKQLLGQDDEIVVKYRMKNDVLLPITAENCAWVSTTQFNTTDDLSYIQTRFNAGELDEIEVITNVNGGFLAHITNIEKSSSTYQVTIDEAIGTAGETSIIRFDNWKKVENTVTQTDGEARRTGLGDIGTFGQLKIEVRGKAGKPEIRQIITKTNTKESL